MGEETLSRTRAFNLRQSAALSAIAISFISVLLMGHIGSHVDITSERRGHQGRLGRPSHHAPAWARNAAREGGINSVVGVSRDLPPQWPERRWLYSSYGAQLSIRDSVQCRRLIESTWYQARWGDRFALTSDQNTKGRFDNDRSGYRLSTSVGGAVTGEGGDRIVCDDPNNVNEVESDSVRKATNDWFDVVMSTRVNDPKTAGKVVVMQRCHQQDLSGHLLEQGGWEHLCLPAEYEDSGRVT